MIRVAMLSQWHVHARGYAEEAVNHPNLEVAAVWDEDPIRGRAWAEQLAVPFFPELDAVLSDPRIDGVIVGTPSSMHHEVIVRAARAGKHIFSEKVLGLTTAECTDIFDAVDAAHVQLMLSLPKLCDPVNVYAQQALSEGLLGDLTMVRCRNAHNGAVPSADRPRGWLPEYFFDTRLTGGGAMIDLGAHPIYLTNRIAGPARAVTANLSSYYERGADDNSVIVVEYQSGALGVVESGFVSNGDPFQLALYGTAGSLLIEDGTVRVRSNRLASEGWVSPTLPAALPSPMDQWVTRIATESVPVLGIGREDMYRLTEINQGALKSSQAGQRIELAR